MKIVFQIPKFDSLLQPYVFSQQHFGICMILVFALYLVAKMRIELIRKNLAKSVLVKIIYRRHPCDNIMLLY